MDFHVLLDAPEGPATRLQLARLGEFHDPRYGDFEITEGDVSEWKANLGLLPGGRALIDLDHRADKTGAARSTEAAGWITDIDLVDGVPQASVEWTPVGRGAIEDQRYLFFSPSFGQFRDEAGLHDNVLTGGALTNKPFLSSMPQVTLASEENVARALVNDSEASLYQMALDGALGEDIKTLASTDQRMREKAVKENQALADGSYPIPDVPHLKSAIILAQSGHGKAAAAKKLIKRRAKELGREDLLPDDWGAGSKQLSADSRRPMELNSDILSAFGVTDENEQLKILDVASEEDADAGKVLEAIKAAKPAEEEPETRTLEQHAKDEGKIVLDSGAYEELRSGAAAGADSKKQLDAMTFETAFERAKGKGQAVEGDREFYGELPLETAVKRLESAPQIVNVKPIGKNITTDGLDAPENVNPQAFQLDQDVKAHMVENSMKPEEYVEALHQVEAKQVAA